MKKLLILLLILCLIPLPSFANSWGLKSGAILDAVLKTQIWNDYTTITGQLGDIAVMGSRYHNCLMILEGGDVRVYTTAVYQPGENKKKKLSLTGGKDIFTLSYGEEESYTFMDNGYCYQLSGATIGDYSIRYDGKEACYYAAEGGQTAVVLQQFPLSRFNIRLFPRSMEQVQHLNQMHACLSSGEFFLGLYDHQQTIGQRLQNVGKGTAPVYSAPFGKSAWRAAKGKAAVSLDDELWVHGIYTNQDGESYAMIHYAVSQRTHRFGFVDAAKLGDQSRQLESFYPLQVPLRAKCDTYLTDDPMVSQFAQFEVPKDTLFTCFGLLNDDYAYVGTEVKNGAFVSGGQMVWGFVPLRDLEVFLSPVEDPSSLPFMGTLQYHSGLEMLHSCLTLMPDGSFICDEAQDSALQLLRSTRGRWQLFYNGGLFGADYPYVLVLTGERGEVFVRGLSCEENVVTLNGNEGYGCYVFQSPAE